MGSTSLKKRSRSGRDDGPNHKPTKKQRKALAAYHSSSSEAEEEDNKQEAESDDDEGGPIPTNLLDSEDDLDLDEVEVDDGASTGPSGSDSDSAGSESEVEKKSNHKKQATKKQQEEKEQQQPQKKKFMAKDAPESDSDDDNDGDNDEDDEDDYDQSDDDDDGLGNKNSKNTKSKRNDPDAFAISMSKMLSSKLPASKRADPIVARSAAAAENARQLVDSVLEAKAKKRLREQKRLAMEKGRVRDVLVASTTKTLNIATGEIEEKLEEGAETTGEILATERRLRKVAQRGVVKLFNAVREAQVKAAEAEREARKEGIVGVKRKEEKVTEMSRKGFLDLIANGGGGLKKGGLEEA